MSLVRAPPRARELQSRCGSSDLTVFRCEVRSEPPYSITPHHEPPRTGCRSRSYAKGEQRY